MRHSITFARYTAPILIALMVVITTVGEIQATETQKMNVTVDVRPTDPHYGTTLVSSLTPLMSAAKHPEWTPARLMGVMGHAFHYDMKAAAATVYHDWPDWRFALDYLPELGSFAEFNASSKDKEANRPKAMREAKEAVRASLERGVPALVWQPMTKEMKANHHSAYCWGLIVGFNDDEDSYTIRHPFVKETYTIRYDAFGHADPVEWFNVKVLENAKSDDKRGLHLKALKNAVKFAHGIQYTDETFKTPDGKQMARYGFAAYEVWGRAFTSGKALASPPQRQKHNARMLRFKRQAAAAYLRELVSVFPDAAEPLEAAASHYDRELQPIDSLVALFDSVVDRDLYKEAGDRGAYTEAERAEAGRLIDKALETEREAVAQIEASLAILEGK